MALVIGYEGSTRRLLKAIELGWDDTDPDDVAFLLPEAARKGDRVLYFVGGKFQYFWGYGRVATNWRTGRAGSWKGRPRIEATWTVLNEPVPGADVQASTGLPIPRGFGVVPPRLATAVWKAARGRPLIPIDRAMEGATTEARSRYRNPKLRRTALQLANGRCEACGGNFAKRVGGLGAHCLVVHHKKQLKDTDQPRETKLSELAVLCANCHMMVHADPTKAMTVAQLRRRLGR